MLHATGALILLAAAVLAAQSQAPAGLDTVLQQAEGQRAAYVATFRNVTATETRVTEVFDDRGRVEKQRTLVSNFLVYQSRFDPAVLSEYRIPLTVDGRPTGKPEQDAIKLFGRLAKARSTAEELGVLKEQNVVLRSDSEYANSALDILVPRRVVSEYYRKSGKKNGPQSLRLAVRLTTTYADFKRFDVSTVSDIRLPAGKEQ